MRNLTPRILIPALSLVLSSIAIAQSTGSTKAVRLVAPSGTALRPGTITLPDNLPPEIAEKLRAQMLKQGVGAPSAADDPAKPKGIDPKRTKMFKGLKCDRRSSNILKLWSTPEPKPVDEDDELKLPKEIAEAPKASVAPEPVATPEDPEVAASAEHKKKFAAYAEALKKHQADQKAFPELQKAWTKKNTEYKKEKAKIEGKRLAREFEIFARDITLGRWDRLSKLIESLGKDEKAQKAIYTQLLQKLPRPGKQSQQGGSAMYAEKNQFDFQDIRAIIELAPGGIDKKQIPMIPSFVNMAIAQGYEFEAWLDVLRAEGRKTEKERSFDKRTSALFLAAQRRDLEMGEFLPSLKDATEKTDRVGLNLLARHFLAKHAKEKKNRKQYLDQAWQATLSALSAGKIEKEDKQDALRRAVELAPKVKDELGVAWLEESFTKRPQRGMEVIAIIGGEASRGLQRQGRNAQLRLATLTLMKEAIDALLEKAPERAQEWSSSLNLLADVWLREAAHSYRYSKASSRGPITRRDPFGNIYWTSYGYNGAPNGVVALNPGELLKLRPTGAWRKMIEGSVAPKYDTTIAELYLKVNEEKLAFPYIQQLAVTNLDKANQLAKEFLNVWIKNNDPNSARQQTNIYMFSFGFNNRAGGIPLTRSRQERNLRDLAKWIGKLRAIDGIELDTPLLVRAFTTSHSAAEVYRIEAMEEVFGTLEDLDPKTLATMAQGMRSKLASVWRKPATQQRAGTNRKQKDIEAEVQKGYALAQEVLQRALQAHPDSWRLLVARAAMIHDLNNYRNDIKKSSEFSGTRKTALNLFAKAVATYAKTVNTIEEADETVEAFDYWFQAALGASDIPAISQDTILARHEIPKIKQALEALGGKVGERHMSKFANSLFTRLSSVNPAVKSRFLEAGFEIVGDNPQAAAARKELDYYKDVVTEIKLVASVDGTTDVGTKPFGLKIDLRFTKQTGTESGGFSKYLQNQANATNLYYNYGRPQENYRDKFEESIRSALQDQFEITSITFNSEDAPEKASEPYGWRRVPYAYILLKAKGEEIDRIPPLKMDLDFTDRTGYVVLPISSGVVPIDASALSQQRPCKDLEVTQILDERKAEEGILSLEIRAQATGLIPDLRDILDLSPSDFEIERTDDQGVSVSRFGDDKDSIRSERLWVVSMKAKEGVENPTQFRFAAPRSKATKVIYQRYDDADLMTASLEVDLLAKYGVQNDLTFLWILLPLLAGLGYLGWSQTELSKEEAEAVGVQLPSRINAFSVLELLRGLRGANRLSDAEKQEIDGTIQRIEQHYFHEPLKTAPDLQKIASDWVLRA